MGEEERVVRESREKGRECGEGREREEKEEAVTRRERPERGRETEPLSLIFRISLAISIFHGYFCPFQVRKSSVPHSPFD